MAALLARDNLLVSISPAHRTGLRPKDGMFAVVRAKHWDDFFHGSRAP
jgi:hypothetical protein